MTNEQIGLVIQFIQDCKKETTVELVLYICNVIDPSVTLDQCERAISLKKSQDATGWIF